MFTDQTSTPPFSFTDMLTENFDASVFNSSAANTNIFPISCKVEPNTTDTFIPSPIDSELTNWLSDFNQNNLQNVARKRNTKQKNIQNKKEKKPKDDNPDKKLNEKEKHKERQRKRRKQMTDTMDVLKSLVPECVKYESETAPNGKKKKVVQSQLLEMTVDYIKDLHVTVDQLQQENSILRACVENQNNISTSNDIGISSDSSQLLSSSPDGSPLSSNSFFESSSENNIYDDLELDSNSLLTKRNLSSLYQNDMDQYDSRPKKQPAFVRAARVLMAIFVVGLFFYNPITYPTSSLSNTSPMIGRVLQSQGTTILNHSPAVSTSWFLYFSLSVIVKILMIMFWTFAAMLLDHIYVPPAHLVNLAKKENNLGVKKFDRGDYQASRHHFEKAMTYLGRSPKPTLFTRVFHLPLEMWRQVLHLLRIGLWCDVYLVNQRGGQKAMLEVARANHYLFTLNILSNNMDAHSVLFFLVSLNAAESLYQKPPVLAEVYATVAIAFYGLLKMPKAYQYLMGKAWNIVDNFKDGQPNSNSSVDNTKALLLFLSSYGSLCDGNLQQVQTQIQRGCDLFLKEGNKNMFFQGQFLISYTHFLRGNYFTTMQIMKSIEVCNLGDPRISWWRELLIISCKLCLHDTVTEKDLINFEMLYSKVESHSTFAPTLAVLQQSILALLLLRIGNRKRALSVAVEALDVFENSSFTGWIFYCGFYISEVFFAIWEEEKGNTQLTNRISRMTHRLCYILRKVGKFCELARPVSYMVIGRYALNMGDHDRAIDYLEMAAESAEDCKVDTYKVQASCLIDRARFESQNVIDDCDV